MSAGLYAAGAGVNAVSNLVGGKDEFRPANLHLVNGAQMAGYQDLMRKLLAGDGDHGFGTAVKQGKTQIQQMLADLGVSANSGYGAAAMGDMVANAASQDSANRVQTMLELIRTPLQTAQTQGANFIPGSPSAGMDANRQYDNYRARNRFAYGDSGAWGGPSQSAINRVALTPSNG